jgi:TRAP-type C4-dicarboxylate transport system permease small subunit
VDFFTAKVSDTGNAWLDRLGALVLGACMLLLAWRTGLGGMSAYSNQSGTMMLGFPEWIVYAFMAPPMVLTGVIGIAQAITGNTDEVTA